MILGEPQIFGQMKAAFAESCTAGAVSSALHRLFQNIFMLAKEIRTTTAIGACPVSVASAAAHFAKTQHPNFEKANIVLVGAGDTCALLLRYLKIHEDVTLSLVNRNVENALALTDEFAIPVYGLDELPDVLMHADVVFSATGSPVPLITQNLITKVMAARSHKPLSLIDIAVPRDIEATVNDIEHVALYCIDDLKSIIEVNRQGREHAASKAQEMINIKSAAFMSQYHSQVTHTIRTYRSQIEDICSYELKKAKQQLNEGRDAHLVLEAFAHNFTNKLLHAPSVQLRKAGAQGRFDLLHFAKKLFAIHETEVELP
jgi:glutamyl-tRNA reductase